MKSPAGSPAGSCLRARSPARRATTRRSRRSRPIARAKISTGGSACQRGVEGTAAQWARPIGRHTVLVGAEAKFIKGDTQETQLSAGRVLATLNNGGTQQVWSTFIQDTFLASDRLTLVMGAHGDRWHTQSQNTSYNKTLGSFNPRASVAYRLGGGLSLRGSAYKGFRAPTLNELYRGFRAGNTQTNPNEALAPERLTGGDGGVLATRGRLSARVTGFWNVLDDVITNVTLSTTPQLITKQRANADKMRTAGVEFETAVRLPASLSAAFVERDRRRAIQGRYEPARQPRAAGAGVQPGPERPLQPPRVDRLRPASGDGRAIRGRSERVHGFAARPCWTCSAAGALQARRARLSRSRMS